MDLNWERSYPYYQITKSDFLDIYPEWKRKEILELKLITIGCRNSNYEILTRQGKYLLRITTDDSALMQNELLLNKQLSKLINSPKIIAYKKRENRYFLIYEFIEGINFSQHLNSSKINNNEISKIAESLAKIHSITPENFNSIIEMDLPPFEMWYDYFLSNKKTLNILGIERENNVRKFIKRNRHLFEQISSYNSFIHSDFRPANMIITPTYDIYIVDWEYSTKGHSLADIGQFFRYQECFNEKDKELFVETYNSFASRKLPSNWYLLSRLRDLVNPLQLLGSVEKKQQQEIDLLRVIDEIIQGK